MRLHSLRSELIIIIVINAFIYLSVAALSLSNPDIVILLCLNCPVCLIRQPESILLKTDCFLLL